MNQTEPITSQVSTYLDHSDGKIPTNGHFAREPVSEVAGLESAEESSQLKKPRHDSKS